MSDTRSRNFIEDVDSELAFTRQLEVNLTVKLKLIVSKLLLHRFLINLNRSPVREAWDSINNKVIVKLSLQINRGRLTFNRMVFSARLG